MMVAMLVRLPERARTPAVGTLQPLGAEVDDLVGELERRRVALEETAG